MIIDEAIEKHRRIAETKKTLYDACILEEYNRHLLREYKEHEQLAYWLEELKSYRECNICKYNKAIDDAKNVILQTLDNEILIDTLNLRLEQLKAGGKNGTV